MLDFAIFGKEGAGLRMLTDALGGHPQLYVSTQGMDGFTSQRIYGKSGKQRGLTVSYQRAQILFNDPPPRIIHLLRAPQDNARELLAIRSSIIKEDWMIGATAAGIRQDQKFFKAKLAYCKDVEIHEITYEDLIDLSHAVNEALTDFLFVRFHKLKVRRLSDGK